MDHLRSKYDFALNAVNRLIKTRVILITPQAFVLHRDKKGSRSIIIPPQSQCREALRMERRTNDHNNKGATHYNVLVDWMMKIFRILLPTALALSSFSFASGQLIPDRHLSNNDLPPCKGNDFEYDFYTVDASIRGLENECNEVQLTAIGALIQDIISETELVMPEYKREYMKALVCLFAQEEEDKERRLLLKTDHRRLTTATRWTWKGRRGTCRRCKNRTTARYLTSAFTTNKVCAETEKALRHKSEVEQTFESIGEMLVSITEMAWLHGEDFESEIQAMEGTVQTCEKASTLAATAARTSMTLCEQALANDDSSSRIRKLARKAQQATKDTEDAVLQASDALVQIEHLKKDMELQIEFVDTSEDLRELGSDEENVSVADVCAQVDAAKFHQTLAEADATRATDIVQEMKDMSKDFSHHKDVEDVIKDAEKIRHQVEDKKDETLNKVKEVQEKCDKAKEKPKDAAKLLKEAKKRTEDVAKKALETNEKLSELKEEEENMLELAEILGFDPVMAELKDTVQKDNERISEDIEKIEEEVAKIDEQLKPPVTQQVQTTATPVNQREKATPVTQQPIDEEQKKLLELKRSAYVQREGELQGLKVNNQKIIQQQDDEQRKIYYSSTSIGRGSENGSPLQIIMASYRGFRKSAVNWNPYTQTTTLSQWFEKFATLLLDSLERDLPKFNKTTGGCLDGPFGIIVNVTEVEGVLDEPKEDFTTCERTDFD